MGVYRCSNLKMFSRICIGSCGSSYLRGGLKCQSADLVWLGLGVQGAHGVHTRRLQGVSKSLVELDSRFSSRFACCWLFHPLHFVGEDGPKPL